ncbi:MAG: hypothetical protein ACM35G_00890 [Planctomycetaceae bacterium]
MAQHFALGWDPGRAAIVRAQLRAQGRYCGVIAGPAPPAWSLSMDRLRHLEQGQAGTCWAHSGTQNAEVFARSKGYEAFPICRRLVAWGGKQLEGGGNPSDGGTATDALLSMTAEKGIGIAHEDLCPYTDDRRTLGTRPPQAVFDDAKKGHLVAIVDVTSDEDARRLIGAGIPVSNGLWWPFGWDHPQTFMDSIGSGTYGHALTEIGYAMPGVFDEHAWFQFDNWHGLLYPPLPAALAEKVPGYRPITPERTSDFWVRADVYERVRNFGAAERVGATDLDGLGKVVTIPGFLDAFPV